MERADSLEGGIVVYSHVPAKEFAAIRRSLAFPIVTVSIAILSALLFLFMRRLVIDPSSSLSNAARPIGEGHDEVALEPIGSDEIGALTDRCIQGHACRAARFGAQADRVSRSHRATGAHRHADRIAEPTRLSRSSSMLACTRETGPIIGPRRCFSTWRPSSASTTRPATRENQLLIGVTKRLSRCVAGRVPEAPVARFGGDDFTLLLPGADADGATVIAQRIGDALREPIAFGGREMAVGTSIGIALHPGDASDAARLLGRA